jgi:serine/threonine protein kinase
MKSLAPNTLLQNRYLIVHLIGKGGMGDVYLAVDQRLGSACALKRTFFADDETLGNAFEREAKTLARLRHPVLPKVSDHFVENGEQFLVMEHISGDDLSKRLETSQKPFPLSWVLFWADQLLDALAYLHAHEPPIIHRDIKPQNLKLTDENSIILLDFGLSKNNAGDTRRISSGSTGSVVGYTPHYAPMEQIRGTGTNPRSDIYALSATVYQLMTNMVPSDALTRADALLNGMEDPIRSLSEINPEIPQAVSAVILKGMEISQDRRFPNAREMQKTLREAYSQIQNQMSAQTVAFNLQSESNGGASSQSLPAATPEKPEVSSVSPTSQPKPDALNSNSSLHSGNSAANRDSVSAHNFDATLQMDSQAPLLMPEKQESGNSQPRQADVKTEVFLAGSSPIIPPAPLDLDFGGEKSLNGGNPSVPESFNSNPRASSFSAASDSFPNYDAPSDSEFFSSPLIAAESDAFATVTPTRSYKQADFFSESDDAEEGAASERPKSPVAPIPAVKKSSNKSVAIFGGLFALFALAVVASGTGWYLYQNRAAATVTIEETPTPEPSVEFSPTPAPTLEAVIDNNANSAATNADSEIVSSNSNSENELLNADNETNTQTPADNAVVKPRTGSTPVVSSPRTPQVTDRNTPPRANPTTKPVAKPTAKKPNVPDILQ